LESIPIVYLCPPSLHTVDHLLSEVTNRMLQHDALRVKHAIICLPFPDDYSFLADYSIFAPDAFAHLQLFESSHRGVWGPWSSAFGQHLRAALLAHGRADARVATVCPMETCSSKKRPWECHASYISQSQERLRLCARATLWETEGRTWEC
jgi:hypothetical protein